MIELVVAMALLGVVSLSLGRFMGGFLHSVGTSTMRTTAAEVAEERIAMIMTDPEYTNLDTRWTASETGFSGYRNMARQTTFAHRTSNTPRRDYFVITVRVTEPTMSSPVVLTNVVAKP